MDGLSKILFISFNKLNGIGRGRSINGNVLEMLKMESKILEIVTHGVEFKLRIHFSNVEVVKCPS